MEHARKHCHPAPLGQDKDTYISTYIYTYIPYGCVVSIQYECEGNRMRAGRAPDALSWQSL